MKGRPVKLLLDTNVISEFIRPRPAVHVIRYLQSTPTSQLFLSVMTIGEIRFGVARARPSPKTANILNWLERGVLAPFAGQVLDVDQETADIWATLAASAMRKSRPPDVVDTLIAATAIRHGLTLATRNTKDFDFYEGLRLLNPWDLQ